MSCCANSHLTCSPVLIQNCVASSSMCMPIELQKLSAPAHSAWLDQNILLEATSNNCSLMTNRLLSTKDPPPFQNGSLKRSFKQALLGLRASSWLTHSLISWMAIRVRLFSSWEMGWRTEKPHLLWRFILCHLAQQECKEQCACRLVVAAIITVDFQGRDHGQVLQPEAHCLVL